MDSLITAITQNVLPGVGDPGQVRELAEKYPYVPAFQLLLALQLKEQGDDTFEEQWQKTLLYFNNPLWLQHLVESNGPAPAETQNKLQAATALPAGEDMTAGTFPSLKIEPANTDQSDWLFTPYHTVDYFASQGIKLGDEAPKPADQFGMQLKSFTEWLKDMRRLPDTKTGGKIDQAVEKAVEKMAASSLDGENADTAAMAEVWLKQGNRQKAIEIYQKLSLQNPAKRAYFAAKIEHVKKML